MDTEEQRPRSFGALEKRPGMIALYLANLLLMDKPVSHKVSKPILRQIRREQGKDQ